MNPAFCDFFLFLVAQPFQNKANIALKINVLATFLRYLFRLRFHRDFWLIWEFRNTTNLDFTKEKQGFSQNQRFSTMSKKTQILIKKELQNVKKNKPKP